MPNKQVKNLRYWRRIRGYTQEGLAQKIGVNTATISRIESGKNEPLPSTITAIASALDVNPADIQW